MFLDFVGDFFISVVNLSSTEINERIARNMGQFERYYITVLVNLTQ